MGHKKAPFTTLGLFSLFGVILVPWYLVVRNVAQPMVNGNNKEVTVAHIIINGFWFFILFAVVIIGRHFYLKNKTKKILKGEIDPW